MPSANTGTAGLHLFAVDPGTADVTAVRKWYEAEHIPALLDVEGVSGVNQWEVLSRYVRAPEGGMQAVPAEPTYVVACELDDVDVALTEEFLDATGRSYHGTATIGGEKRPVETLMSVTMSDVMSMENEGASTEPGGMMVVSLTPKRDYIPLFHEWYDTVHLVELLSCPGFQRARRYRALDGIPNFFAFYDLDRPEALEGDRFVGFSTRKFEELPEIQRRVGPNMTSNLCDVYRRLS